MTDLVSQNVETQTVVSHEAIVQVVQEAQEQVVVDNQITTQVEQETHEQTMVGVEITTQVEQETQEQITIGVPGPRGVPGATGPMGSGVAWRGTYDLTTAYELHDAVAYLGSSYACSVPCTGVVPTETSNWELVASKGDTGADGVSDIPGPKGDTGNTGAAGAKGDTGSQGPQGIQGVQGQQGETGVQGIQGVKGDIGADSTVAGPKGDTGDAGPTGDAFAYADFTEGELAVLVGPQGEQGIQGNAGAAGAKGDTGLTGSAGADGVDGVTPVKGVDYFDGADGEQGIQGETGSQGIQGIQGVKGDTGSSGADSTVAGPKGDKGDTGDTGAAGTTSWAGIIDKPSTFTPAAHTHALTDLAVQAAETVDGNPTASPASPAAIALTEQQVLGRITGGHVKGLSIAELSTLLGGIGTMAAATASDYVAKALFDAYTILMATTDNTPTALTVTEQTLLGRITGGAIAALSIAQIRTLLGITAAGAELINDADAAAQRATLGGVIVGPASATDNAIVRFDAATGKLVQNSSVIVDDSGNVGLGTTSPLTKLHVYGSQPIITFENSFDALQGYLGMYTGLTQWAVNRRIVDAFKFDANRASAYINMGALSGGSYISFHTNSVNNADPDQRMIIDRFGNIGIGIYPNENAILDVVSTTKAFMPPRMTTTQRDAIVSPTEGMVIFNITTHVLNFYYTSWTAV